MIRIHFETADYDLRGRIHIRPGAAVGDYLLRSSRVFVPITDVELTRFSEPAFARSLPVVVVNSRHVSRLHLVESRASEAAAPGTLPLIRRVHSAPTLDVEEWPAEDLEVMGRTAGQVHAALAELSKMHGEGLIDDEEFRAKRVEILARL